MKLASSWGMSWLCLGIGHLLDMANCHTWGWFAPENMWIWSFHGSFRKTSGKKHWEIKALLGDMLVLGVAIKLETRIFLHDTHSHLNLPEIGLQSSNFYDLNKALLCLPIETWSVKRKVIFTTISTDPPQKHSYFSLKNVSNNLASKKNIIIKKQNNTKYKRCFKKIRSLIWNMPQNKSRVVNDRICHDKKGYPRRCRRFYNDTANHSELFPSSPKMMVGWLGHTHGAFFQHGVLEILSPLFPVYCSLVGVASFQNMLPLVCRI